MDERRQAGLRDIHARMTAASTHDDAWGTYGDVAAFEREVASCDGRFRHRAVGATPAVAGTLGRVDRVARWMDAHISEAISLDQLCKVAGVGWRPLQKAFLAVKGQSPLEFVASRRLAAVHARLMQAADDVMVSHVAMDLGFSHLGRFAANYRRVYGESPPTPFGPHSGNSPSMLQAAWPVTAQGVFRLRAKSRAMRCQLVFHTASERTWRDGCRSILQAAGPDLADAGRRRSSRRWRQSTSGPAPCVQVPRDDACSASS